MEGKGNQNPYELSYRAAELIYLRSEGGLLALPATSKLFLVILIKRYGEKKALARLQTEYLLAEDVLICSSNEITSSTTISTGVSICLNL